MSEEPKLDAAKRPNGLRAIADGFIYRAGRTRVDVPNVWETADILRSAADEIERLHASLKLSMHDATQETINVGKVKSAWITACKERDEAREALERIGRNTCCDLCREAALVAHEALAREETK